MRVEGTARGDLFETLRIDGTIDPHTGDMTFSGELAGLNLSENLHRRLPAEFRPAYEALALNRGEIDLEFRQVAFHPKAPRDQRFDYDLRARLHGGVWECPALPFPVNDLRALVTIRDGLLTIKHAEGTNGNTTLRAAGSVVLGTSRSCPLDLRLDLLALDLDKRLQDRTPPRFADLWDVFKPKGTVNAYIHLVRQKENGPVGVGATIDCRDVAATYRHFAYPLEHLSGRLSLERQRLSVDLHGLIGERPAVLKGTIDDPGPDARVKLTIEAESIPIDPTFMAALPSDVRAVVDQFHPSGSVKASVSVVRKPMVGPRERPEGHLSDRRQSRPQPPM